MTPAALTVAFASALVAMLCRGGRHRARQTLRICSPSVPLRCLHGREQGVPSAVSGSEPRSHQSLPGPLLGQVEAVPEDRHQARQEIQLFGSWLPLPRVQSREHGLCSAAA